MTTCRAGIQAPSQRLRFAGAFLTAFAGRDFVDLTAVVERGFAEAPAALAAGAFTLALLAVGRVGGRL